MFANIKNGQMAKKSVILESRKNICESFLKVLWDEGFILGYTLQDDYLIALLKYNNSIPAIQNIKTFSKISTPYYVKSKKIIEMIKRNKNSIFLVRTSKGLLSNKDILTYKIGGILIARLR